MIGTKAEHILAMLFTPPKMTTATSAAITTPTSMRAVLGNITSCSNRLTFSLIALACTVFPMPNAATEAKIAKSMDNHLTFNPFSSAYIGPPNILPSAVFSLNLIASKPSPYFVAIPKIPVSQHQSTAPGPPRLTAVATPMMLPVPMVAASDVARAANWLTSPSESLSFFTERRMAVNIFR